MLRARRLFMVLFWVAAAAGLLLALLPEAAWARAGGGGSFGGGGGGSGGGGSGGGGGGELIFYLIWLCVRYPAVGVPVTIVFVLVLIYGGKTTRDRHVSRTIHREFQFQRQAVRDRALAAIKSRDPGFDQSQLLARVSAAFQKIQGAWSRQDLRPARPFISDGIHERFSLQIEMQKAEGYRNVMEDVQVLNPEIVAVHSDDHFDTVHVRIPASAVDYNVDLKSGRRSSGSTGRESFTEFWSFHRRPGAKTLSRPGSIEGNCPNCAAPLNIVDRAQCQACGSTVNSGEHDWVLAEITQAQEWRPPAPQRVPGIDELRQADPAFSVQHIEDRVSVMFYRLKAASFFNDHGYAAPILSGRLERVPSLERMPDDQFWKEPAVGKVELVDVECGGPAGRDRIRAMVRWSGIRCSGTPGGRYREIARKAIYTHLYVLTREHGVKSISGHEFSSSSCGACGAPIAVSEERDCRFCGTSLVDGRHDWVLEDIQAYSHEVAYHLRRQPEARLENTSADGREDGSAPFLDGDAELALAVLARVVQADGSIHPREREALKEFGTQWGLTPAQMQAAFESAARDDNELPVPTDRQEATGCLQQMIRTTLVDGRLSSREKQLLEKYGGRMNYSKADIRYAIARERANLYREARSLRRERKSPSR